MAEETKAFAVAALSGSAIETARSKDAGGMMITQDQATHDRAGAANTMFFLEVDRQRPRTREVITPKARLERRKIQI